MEKGENLEVGSVYPLLPSNCGMDVKDDEFHFPFIHQFTCLIETSPPFVIPSSFKDCKSLQKSHPRILVGLSIISITSATDSEPSKPAD